MTKNQPIKDLKMYDDFKTIILHSFKKLLDHTQVVK